MKKKTVARFGRRKNMTKTGVTADVLFQTVLLHDIHSLHHRTDASWIPIPGHHPVRLHTACAWSCSWRNDQRSGCGADLHNSMERVA